MPSSIHQARVERWLSTSNMKREEPTNSSSFTDNPLFLCFLTFMAASPFFNETHYCYYLCPSKCPLVCFPLPPGLGFPNPPPPPSHSNQNNSHVIIIVAVLVSVFLLLCFCSVLVKHSFHRNISRRSTVPTNTDEDHDQIQDPATHTRYTRTAGVEESLINSITVCKYKKGEGLVEGTECSVCLSEFCDNENLRLLPNCNHAFHLPCIDTWLKSQTNCPLCRASVVSNSIISSAMDPSSVSSQPAAESHQVRNSESHIGLGSNQSNGVVGN